MADFEVSDVAVWNEKTMSGFEPRGYFENHPCPWWNFSELLKPTMFDQLMDEFPPLELFEKHSEIPRHHAQRSHNRHYLAYDETVYRDHDTSQRGIVRFDDLKPSWRTFITALESNKYQSFIRPLLGLEDGYKTRFAWHVAQGGHDVSPHLDSIRKLGTHIFYFNSSKDWSPDWGGGTVFYRGKQTDDLNPEPEDFESGTATSIVDNKSLLFKNNAAAWHGVEPITSPDDKFRRIFNVIIEKCGNQEPPRKRRSLFKKLIGKN